MQCTDCILTTFEVENDTYENWNNTDCLHNFKPDVQISLFPDVFGNLCFDQLNKAPGAQISDVSEDLSDLCVDKAHLGLFEHGPLFQPDGGGCFTVDSFTELIISDLSFSTLQHPIKIH